MLVDHQLLDLIQNGLVDNIELPRNSYSGNSPVQPASVDLHVGSIYKPQQDAGKPGGFKNPLDDVVLEPGEMVIVQTHESVKLPGNIAAIGMPPASLALQGLLILNPGHIDPGYTGTVKLTIINMGRVKLSLTRGKVIFTVLFFQCSHPATADYGQRLCRDKKPDCSGESPMEKALGKLSAYFLNLDERMRHIGREEASLAGLRLQGWQRLFGFLGLVFSVGLLGAGISLASKYASVETTQQLSREREILSESISDLNRRVVSLERQAVATSAGTNNPPKTP